VGLEELLGVSLVDLVVLPEADLFMAVSVIRGGRLFCRAARRLGRLTWPRRGHAGYPSLASVEEIQDGTDLDAGSAGEDTVCVHEDHLWPVIVDSLERSELPLDRGLVGEEGADLVVAPFVAALRNEVYLAGS